MKKLIFLTLFSALTLSSWKVSAQSKITYGLGVKGGMNLSRLIEKNANNKYLLSYLTGVSLEQLFSSRVSLSYALLYSRQGDITVFSNPGLFNRSRTRYNYLVLPIELRYRLKYYPFYITPGFQAGYLLYKRGDFLPKNGSTTYSLDQEEKIDVGLSLGLGCRFSKHFFGEAKYYQSIKTILKPFSAIDPVSGAIVHRTPPDVRNQTLSLSLSYYFLVR